MADITRRIVTRFEAAPGNVRAVLGGMASWYGGTGRAARQAGHDQSYLNSQLRAFGTTVRYAIAGTAVFGAAGTISQLSQIQRQLGLISAIGNVSTPQGQGLLLVGKRLEELSRGSRQLAVETVQPIENINDAIINLLSTVSDVPENEILPMVRDISQAATLAQISAEDATKAFTTMQVAFGRPVNRENIAKTAQEFFMLTRRAPGGAAAGQQVITQLGQLAASSVTAHVSQPQMFALLTSTLRYGIPPAQASRGLQFLLQTIGLPGQQTKDAKAALSSLGISPDFIASSAGGVGALGRIFDEVKKRGFRPSTALKGRLSSLEEEMGGDAELPNAALSGQGAAFAGRIFRRIHAFRTFVALYSQWLKDSEIGKPNTAQELKDFQEAEDGHVRDVEELAQAWKRFQQQTNLPRAAVALQAMGQDIITAFEPILNFSADKITGLQGVVHRHNEPVAFGVAGLLGLLAARRGLKGLFGGAGLFGRGAALTTGLDQAGGQYAGMPGESATNPAYVIVVGQIFGGRGAPGAIPIPPTGGGGRTRGGRRGIPFMGGGWLGMAAAITAYGLMTEDHSIISGSGWRGAGASFKDFFTKGPFGHGDDQFEAARDLQGIQKRFGKNVLNTKAGIDSLPPDVAARVYKDLAKLHISIQKISNQPIKVQGSADLNVNVKQTDASGKTKITSETVNVPLFNVAPSVPTPKPPSAKGKSFVVPRSGR